jgi:hypothetical protein
MKKIFLMMAICSCVILYFGCSLRSSIPYDPSREQFVKQLGMMYEKDIIDFHIKNFKGIFYYQYGFPLPDCYDIAVNMDEKAIVHLNCLILIQ